MPNSPKQSTDVARRLGRYEVVRPLARGGMAEVFLARGSGLHGIQKLVAIKRILPSYAQERQFINMLVDEARISMLISHPNVSTMLEFGEQAGDYFLVMEYVAGQSLSRLTRKVAASREKIDPLTACFIVVEILQGLDAAHNQKDERGEPARIIHRDVSPQNVLISFDGMVKVIDFGIARAARRLEKTRAGTIKGKLRYLAPEMINPTRFGENDNFDHRIDVFAAGVVLFEMLSLKKLFSGETDLDVYKSIMEEAPPDLAEIGLIDKPLMAILNRALSKHAKARYPSAEAFADDLRAYIYRSDPSFTGKRVQQLMAHYFSDLKVEVEQLDAAEPAADFEGPREVTLAGAPLEEPGEKTVGTPNRAPAGLKTTIAAAGADGEPGAPTQAIALEAFEPLSGAHNDKTAAASTIATGQTLVQPAGGVTQAVATSVVHVESTAERTPPTSTDMVAVQAGFRRQGRVLFVVGALLFGVLLAGFIVLGLELSGAGRVTPVAGPVVAAKLPMLIATTPPGAEMHIIGDKAGKAKTPAILMRAPNERFEIEVEHAGYETRRRTVTMPSSGQGGKIELALTPLDVSLKIDVRPKDANVTVDGVRYADGAKVTPERELHIVAKKAGHVAQTRSVTAVAGTPLALSITLQPESVGRSNDKSDKAASSAKERKSTKSARSPRGKSARSTSAREKKADAKVGRGTFKVTSAPWWGEVIVDGEPLDETTPVQVKLPAGKHSVIVRHPPKGLKKSFTITVKPNKTVKRHVQFE